MEQRCNGHHDTNWLAECHILCRWENVLFERWSRTQKFTTFTVEAYRRHVSKNRNGSFKQLCVKNKVVPFPEAGERCPVHILDKYISKLPPEARQRDLFYVRPFQKYTSDPTCPWYTSVPLGKHTLQSKLKNVCRG